MEIDNQSESSPVAPKVVKKRDKQDKKRRVIKEENKKLRDEQKSEKLNEKLQEKEKKESEELERIRNEVRAKQLDKIQRNNQKFSKSIQKQENVVRQTLRGVQKFKERLQLFGKNNMLMDHLNKNMKRIENDTHMTAQQINDLFDI